MLSNSLSLEVSGISGTVVDDYVEITVADTGIGIPEDKISMVFDSFEQINNFSPLGYSGTGLGLSITKNWSNSMGAQLGSNQNRAKVRNSSFHSPSVVQRPGATHLKGILSGLWSIRRFRQQ